MPAQSKRVCFVSINTELAIEALGQEVLSPTSIIEAQLVTVASTQQLTNPAVAH